MGCGFGTQFSGGGLRSRQVRGSLSASLRLNTAQQTTAVILSPENAGYFGVKLYQRYNSAFGFLAFGDETRRLNGVDRELLEAGFTQTLSIISRDSGTLAWKSGLPATLWAAGRLGALSFSGTCSFGSQSDGSAGIDGYVGALVLAADDLSSRRAAIESHISLSSLKGFSYSAHNDDSNPYYNPSYHVGLINDGNFTGGVMFSAVAARSPPFRRGPQAQTCTGGGRPVQRRL